MTSTSAKGVILKTTSSNDAYLDGEISFKYVKPDSGKCVFESQVAIGAENVTHNPSSAFTVDSSSGTKFVALPTATTGQLATAAGLATSPAAGTIAYDSTTNKVVVFNGSAWETVTSA